MAVEISPEYRTAIPSVRSRRGRDFDSMADSVARLTAENGMSIYEVAKAWAVHKGPFEGPAFIEKLLNTPTYGGLSPEEKDKVRTAAHHAIRQNLIQRVM